MDNLFAFCLKYFQNFKGSLYRYLAIEIAWKCGQRRKNSGTRNIAAPAQEQKNLKGTHQKNIHHWHKKHSTRKIAHTLARTQNSRTLMTASEWWPTKVTTTMLFPFFVISVNACACWLAMTNFLAFSALFNTHNNIRSSFRKLFWVLFHLLLSKQDFQFSFLTNFFVVYIICIISQCLNNI